MRLAVDIYFIVIDLCINVFIVVICIEAEHVIRLVLIIMIADRKKVKDLSFYD